MATLKVIEERQVNLLDFRQKMMDIVIGKFSENGQHLNDLSLDIELLTGRVKRDLHLENVEPQEVYMAVKEIFESLAIKVSMRSTQKNVLVIELVPISCG